jgi:hypothetical protein
VLRVGRFTAIQEGGGEAGFRAKCKFGLNLFLFFSKLGEILSIFLKKGLPSHDTL